MSVFHRAATHVTGVVSPAVAKYFADRLDSSVEEIMVAAIARWRQDQWHRFSNHEVNCAVQVYRCARLSNRNALIHIEIEAVELSPAVLQGLATAKTARRPDLRFAVGPRSYILECKRLSLATVFIRAYVDDGIGRFRDVGYAELEGAGAMMGFVQADDPLDIVDAINRDIPGRAGFRASETLTVTAPPPANPSTYSSHHPRVGLGTIDLKHFLVDIR